MSRKKININLSWEVKCVWHVRAASCFIYGGIVSISYRLKIMQSDTKKCCQELQFRLNSTGALLNFNWQILSRTTRQRHDAARLQVWRGVLSLINNCRCCGWPTPARRINISRQGKNTGAKWGEDKHEDVSGGFEKLVRKQQGVLKKRFTRGRIVIITQYNWWYLVNDVLSSTRLVKAYLIYVY